jgi:GntR family transcriptional regulator
MDSAFGRVLSPDMIDEDSGVPLYQQIYDLLRQHIIDGTLRHNERLPAEADFIEALGVSRITIKRAMNELAVAGLVRRQRGLGTVVIYDSDAPTVRGSFETMIDGLTRMGVETEVRLLDCAVIEASPAIAETLDLPAGASVQRIVRVRTLASEPFSYLITYIPHDIADAYDAELLATESLIMLLEQAGHAPVAAEQTISAVAAEGAVAANLGVAPGSPLMCIHRLMKDQAGRIVQNITAFYRADRFEYHMSFARKRVGETDWTQKG